jgi:small-conductance mechanosensitive channel
MPFTYLVAHRLLFVGCTYALALLNYGLGAASLRAYKRQRFVERDEWLPPGVVGRAKSQRAQLALPFLGATFFSLAALTLDQPGLVEFFLGGFFLLQLLSLSFLVTNILTYRLLRDSSAAEGHMKYSAAYRYQSYAAHVVGGAVLALAGLALTGCPAFAGAAFFGAATAAGSYRHSRQARAA